MALYDDTIRSPHSGYRHLVCNGTARIGWLTACGERIKGRLERMPTLNVNCGACLIALDAAENPPEG